MTVSVNEKFLARGTRKEIETKTGIEYPRYRMIERRHFLNGSLMSSDFTMEYTVKFDPAKNAAFYEQVERQLTRKYANEYGDSLLYWAVNKNGNYVFTQPWSESQETLEIEINKNKPEITIQYGSW